MCISLIEPLLDRVLSSSSSTRAVLLSYAGGLISLVAATIASLFGAVALAADWERTGFAHAPRGSESGLVLPLVLQHLTPNVKDSSTFRDSDSNTRPFWEIFLS